MDNEKLRPYKAIVWSRAPDAVGIRRTLMARGREDARAQLIAEFGEDYLISLWNEEDAERPR